ncbi:MAG: GxxExxY protein [Candidatus Cloacimonetes bacterium]|nr:GxxExxY protein [Candidatus Cloacimonadota bacterium]
MNEGERLNQITENIIGIAIEVHRALGPGLLESAYETCMFYDLRQTDMKVKHQKHLPILYKGIKLDCSYRLDFFVEDSVIVELKSVEKLLPIHKSQLLSYLKISGCKVGLLINFNVNMLKKGGIKRVVNNFPDSPRSPRPLR